MKYPSGPTSPSLVLVDVGGHPVVLPSTERPRSEASSHRGEGGVSSPTCTPLRDLAVDAAAICAELIRIDTSNPGKAERPAAEHVAELLGEVGIEGQMFEAEPGRTNYVARLQGDGSSPEALVLHGHLDVVPAESTGWRHHPFSGYVDGEYVWGRGAVDMKDMIAMTLAAVRRIVAQGKRPRRDLVLAFFADEECGTRLGSEFLVGRHPEVFEGATAAIGELGGFSVSVNPTARLYPIQVAEKGVRVVRAIARGTAGHASMPKADSAVVALADAVSRAGVAALPLHMSPGVRTLLAQAGNVVGVDLDPEQDPDALAVLGQLKPWIEATVRNTITPTVLSAGRKTNVIPEEAEAMLDCRFVPGGGPALTEALNSILGPDVRWETLVEAPAVEAPWDHPLVHAMAGALKAEDPVAHAVPFMIPAGTDAKNLSKLGMACYGFAPLLLPHELDFASLFHGVDERVPLEALAFGSRVLYRLLTAY